MNPLSSKVSWIYIVKLAVQRNCFEQGGDFEAPGKAPAPPNKLGFLFCSQESFTFFCMALRRVLFFLEALEFFFGVAGLDIWRIVQN